jgi:phytoene dehydrogenase-like protein
LVAVIKENGGTLVSGARVTEIITTDGKATGVKTSDGTVYEATKIIANVNPALIPNLLPTSEASKPEVSKVKNFRPGLGTMMIHLALSDLPDWTASEARGFNYVHIAPYVDDLAMTYTVAAAGQLPTTPALVIGQPTVSDPSRAPEGKHVLWIQVRVLPLEMVGTTWDQVGEEYADRIIENIEQYAPGLKAKILARKVLTPTDLERYNANLIKGDSLGGSHHPAQFFFLRPLPGWTGHKAPIKNLFICGSGTWPGGGVGGGSGLMVANLLSK